MKRFWLFANCYLLFALFLPIALFAQTSQTGSDYVAKRIQLLLSNAPQPVPNASVFVSGNPGPATYYYWIVTQTSVGASSPAGPFQVINAPNTLSASNFNQISWSTVAGATYDVLRTSNTGPPSGACNCAVATAVAGNSVSDQANALGAYTVNTLDPGSLTVILQNINGSLGLPGLTIPSLIVTGPATFSSLNTTTLFADQQAGIDACAKIMTCFGLLPPTGGIVSTRGFQGNQNCASGITFPVGKPVLLEMGPWALISGSNVAITVPAGAVASIKGIGPITNGTGTTSAIASSASTSILWNAAEGSIEDIDLFNQGTGNGLTLQASGTNNVQHNYIKHLHIGNSGTIAPGSVCVRLIANSATALVTENEFHSIICDDFDRSIQLETSGTQGPTDNYFYGVTLSGFSSLGTAGINILSGDANQFIGGFISLRTTGINVASGTTQNEFGFLRIESNTTNISDNGTGTTFDPVTLDANTVTGTDSTRIIVGNGNVLFTQTIARLTGTQEFQFGCNGTATSSATLFLEAPGGATPTCTDTAGLSRLIASSAGTIANLQVSCVGAGKVASSGVFTIVKNTVAQALTCTVGTSTVCSDTNTAHNFAVVAGDNLTVRYTTQATETLANCAASFEKW